MIRRLVHEVLLLSCMAACFMGIVFAAATWLVRMSNPARVTTSYVQNCGRKCRYFRCTRGQAGRPME
jgi:hypothetical protein